MRSHIPGKQRPEATYRGVAKRDHIECPEAPELTLMADLKGISSASIESRNPESAVIPNEAMKFSFTLAAVC